MTQIANFDIATDLKVEFYLPDEEGNVFILGISNLGGEDVLGGTGQFILGSSLLGGTDLLYDSAVAFTWQAVEASTISCEVNVGGSIRDTMFFYPDAASAKIELQSYSLDPNVNTSIRPGTSIRVRIDDGVTTKTLFTGDISNVDASYYPDGPNLISIEAYDIWRSIVNNRIDLDTTGFGAECHTNDVIETIAIATGAGYSALSDYTDGCKMHTVDLTDVAVGQYSTEAIQVGLGILWCDQETGEIIYKNRPAVISTVPEGTYTVGNNHPATPEEDPYHLCMNDIEISVSEDVVFNSLRVELESDPAVYVVHENIDSIQLYGRISRDETVNTTNHGQLSKWADQVMNSSPTKLVKTVETPAIDRLGNLTQAAFFDPGTIVGVDFEENILHINDYYTITKVSHSIDVNAWFTTLELWKEF